MSGIDGHGGCRRTTLKDLDESVDAHDGALAVLGAFVGGMLGIGLADDAWADQRSVKLYAEGHRFRQLLGEVTEAETRMVEQQLRKFNRPDD